MMIDRYVVWQIIWLTLNGTFMPGSQITKEPRTNIDSGNILKVYRYL